MQRLYQPVIVRKEIDDSHYYFVNDVYVPGVTTILHETLPTPAALRKWIGDVGNEKAQEKLESAGDRGTKIHNACEQLLKGQSVNLWQEFPSYTDKKCIIAFINWANEFKPEIRDHKFIEFTLASEYGYAGTMDLFCYIDGEPWIVDFKTSSGVYDSFKLQLVAYRQAFYEMTGIMAKMGILHLNFRTKLGWTFIDEMKIGGKDVEFEDFLKVMDMYKMLNGGEIKPPKLREVFPEVVSLYTRGGETIQ